MEKKSVITEVAFDKHRNRVMVTARMNTDRVEILFHFNDNEVQFTKEEFIGLTKSEATRLRNNRYFQSPVV